MYKHPNESKKKLLSNYLSDRSLENRNALIELYYNKIQETIRTKYSYLHKQEQEDIINNVSVDLISYLDKIKSEEDNIIRTEYLYKLIEIYATKHTNRLKKSQNLEVSLEEILREKHSHKPQIDTDSADQQTQDDIVDELILSCSLNTISQDSDNELITEIRDILPIIKKIYLIHNNEQNYNMFCDCYGINADNSQEDNMALEKNELIEKYHLTRQMIYKHIQDFTNYLKDYLSKQQHSDEHKEKQPRIVSAEEYMEIFFRKKKRYEQLMHRKKQQEKEPTLDDLIREDLEQ